MKKFVFCIFLSLFVLSIANYGQIPFPDYEPTLKTEKKGNAGIEFFTSKIEVRPLIQIRLTTDSEPKTTILPEIFLKIAGTKAVIPNEAYFIFYLNGKFSWQNEEKQIVLMSGEKIIYKGKVFVHQALKNCADCRQSAAAFPPYSVFRIFATSENGAMILGGKEFKLEAKHFQAFRDMIDLIEKNAGTSK